MALGRQYTCRWRLNSPDLQVLRSASTLGDLLEHHQGPAAPVLTAMHDFPAWLPPIPTLAALIVLGLAFLVGLAVGITVEMASLRARERQLARGRRHFTDQVRRTRFDEEER